MPEADETWLSLRPPAEPRWGDCRDWDGRTFAQRRARRQFDNSDRFDVEDILFTMARPAGLAIGAAVQIRAGEPPSVHISTGRKIGEIDHRIRHLLMVRFKNGYCIAGHVIDIDPRGETGSLRIMYLRTPVLQRRRQIEPQTANAV